MEALNPRWLSIELNDVNREVESWNPGREPLNSQVQEFPHQNRADQNADVSDQNPEANITQSHVLASTTSHV